METVAEVKDLTLNLIKDLNEAQMLEVIESLELTVKEEKKSNKEAVRNVLIRHLTSEDIEDSPDGGLDVYKKVAEQVSEILDATYEDNLKLKALKSIVESGEGGSTMSPAEQKLKDLEEEAKKDQLLEKLLKMKLEATIPLGKRSTRSDAVEDLLQEYKLLNHLGPVVQHNVEENAEDSNSESADEDKGNGRSSNRFAAARESERTEVKRMKLKDFKIEGGVIGGEKNSLDYCSLRFQMEEGLHQGYTTKEVRTGVIKAIKAGTTTRRYFERNATTMNHQEFLKTLRTLYDNSDTNDLVDEMIDRVQEKGETEKEYFMAMFELRDNINEVTQGDEEPLGKKFVQKRMLRAISVGLRKDTVRLEMQDVLKDVKKTDNQLLAEVKEVVSRDTENKKKMKKTGGVNVNALSGFSDNDDEHRGRSKSLDRGMKSRDKSNHRDQSISRDQSPSTDRRVSFKSEPSSRKDEPSIASVLAIVNVLQTDLQEHTKTVETLQKQVAEVLKHIAGNTNQRTTKTKFLRCVNCEATNSFCTHCTKCNEGGHKRFNCPKNN